MTKAGWHIDRTIPLAMILTILVQIGTTVWFFAKMDSRVANLEEKGREEKVNSVETRREDKDWRDRLTRVEIRLVEIAADLRVLADKEKERANAEKNK